jgi:Zn-dependent protease|tara:strand:+ start:25613 stop:26203 length:591 start_codon:yes stop_codon:yes gene_type:complete
MKFSKIELKELVISILVISLAIAYTNSWSVTLFMMVPALIIVAPAFAFHELGHKFAAQKFGYKAEYRMWKNGLIAALAMAVVTSWFGSKFLFIAPGAVYFGGRHGTRSDVGKIGFAGPLVNLGLIGVFGLISVFSVSPLIASLASTAVYVNAFLAVFNLIPFGPLDGRKILEWNRTYWGIALAIALAALFWGNLLV